jgi:hypothetical protein
MLTDSRFVDQEFPILIQRESPGLTSGKAARFSYATTRKGRERGKFPILFPVNGNLPAQTGSSGLRPPPSSPDKQRWFPDSRK